MKLRFLLWATVIALSSTLFACGKTTSNMPSQEPAASELSGVDPYAQFSSSVRDILLEEGPAQNNELPFHKEQLKKIEKLLQGLGLATATDVASPEVASSAGVLDTDKNANEKFLRGVSQIYQEGITTRAAATTTMRKVYALYMNLFTH